MYPSLSKPAVVTLLRVDSGEEGAGGGEGGAGGWSGGDRWAIGSHVGVGSWTLLTEIEVMWALKSVSTATPLLRRKIPGTDGAVALREEGRVVHGNALEVEDLLTPGGGSRRTLSEFSTIIVSLPSGLLPTGGFAAHLPFCSGIVVSVVASSNPH